MKTNIKFQGRKFFVVLTVFFIVMQICCVFVPVIFAFLWSLVDPNHPWSYPDAFPKSLSLAPREYVFKYTNLFRALGTSYTIAPLSALLAFVLALPTAYVLGRKNFRGKTIISNLILLPIILPGMVVALFLSRVFSVFGLAQTFPGLVLGHCLMGIPYMIRILATSLHRFPRMLLTLRKTWARGHGAKYGTSLFP